MKLEELEIWKDALELSINVYTLMKNTKDFGLRDQMQRAAVSVPSNIAEGFERGSNKEFIRFLFIANGSLAELKTQSIIARRIEIILEEDFNALLNQIKILSSMINKLIKVRKETF